MDTKVNISSVGGSTSSDVHASLQVEVLDRSDATEQKKLMLTKIHKKAPVMICKEHNNPLRVFCETCQELVCHNCIAVSHQGHSYDFMFNCYNKQKQLLKSTFTAVNDMKKMLAVKISAIEEELEGMIERSELIKKEIHMITEEIVDAVRQSEKNLIEEVEAITDSKLRVLTSQKYSADSIYSQIDECIENVQRNLELENYQEILQSKKAMMEQMNYFIDTIKVEHFNPKEKCNDVQFIKNSKYISDVHHIGDIVVSSIRPDQCKIKKINSQLITYEDRMFSFPLSIQLSALSLVTVPLSSLSCSVISSTPINTTVTSTDHPGVYRIHCTPVIRGDHQVNIVLDDIRLESVSIVVPFNPYLDTITPIRIIKGFAGPFSVAMNMDGHIIVGERLGQRLTVINKAGKKIKSLKKGQLSCPRGVAITPDNCFIIADDQTIKKISMDEKLIAQRGDDKQDQFNFPWGVAVSPQTGNIYVADSNNHIVQVLNSTLKYQFLFGRYGQTPGKFENPHFLTVHNQEASYLYVSSNHCIQKFTLSGKFISQFGTEGSGPGQLHSPEGIAVTDNYVYIADWGNDRISVFTTDGKFVRCFGSKGINKDQFQSPRGIATDSEGHLYICDFGNNRIVVY